MRIYMKVLTTLLFLSFGISYGSSQERRGPEDSWKWIIPTQTKKIDIEKKFGSSISADTAHPFQTYEGDFGKITVVYATKDRQRVDDSSCFVGTGTVLNYSVAPRDLHISDLGYDLRKFERDSTYAPREVGYFSELLGILITTRIVESPDDPHNEQVVIILYRFPKDSDCACSR